MEKPSRTFSIKDLMEGAPAYGKHPSSDPVEPPVSDPKMKDEFTPEAFEAAWTEFTGQLQGEGPRIISMFKSIKPEFENAGIIKLHLENAAQKDTFVLNYRQRLISFLQNRFRMPELEIETCIDLSDSDQILYTDEQKSSYLFNKYPVLKELKKAFNLDIP